MQELIAMRQGTLEQLKQNQMFQRIMTGDLDKNLYAGYLINVYHYAQHSPNVIALASSRCVSSHPDLAAYLMHHATEEIGHELWAYADLKKLGLSDEQITSSRPGTACTSMIGMEYFVAGHWNAVALFGWLFVLEALGDDAGQLVAAQLDASLKLAGQATYFLGGHGTADHDHIRDIIDSLDQYMKDPSDISDMLHIATVSRDLYLGILEEVVAEDKKWL